MDVKRKILIFGGSFSPPTLAHEAIIDACLKLPQFDEVWVMPSGDRLDKTIAATDNDRIKMLEVIKRENFGSDPRLAITDFELRLPRPTKTSRTFPLLKDEYPGTEFWLALGRDSYMSMPEWPDGRALQQALKMVVFYSGGDTLSDVDNVMTVQLPDALSDTSSSHARQAIAGGSYADTGVSQPVLGYIKQHNLYGGK